MSLRSKSPDDNSSQLSVSSLDSALNHSREEEELRGLTMDQCYDDQCSNDEIEKVFSHSKFFFVVVPLEETVSLYVLLYSLHHEILLHG